MPPASGGAPAFQKALVMGTIEGQHGFDQDVPPDEPMERANDKSRPPEAPSLRRKVEPPQ